MARLRSRRGTWSGEPRSGILASVGSSGSPLAAGARFGPYRVLAPLGSGGMSVLYRATDESLGRDVALKVMAPDLSEDPEFRARFTTEARLASHVDHPNIVPIYAFGEGDGEHAGQLYIAMRYVPGEDLRAALRRVGKLEPAGVTAALVPIAQALDAVHRAGLVHRDVKPDNILLQWDDLGGIHPYLADFGLTRTGSGSGLTRTGQMLGTLAYAAPEQIRGETLGPATDVYAMGAVLYECLTGAKPFPRDNEGAVIYAHLSDAVPSVNALAPELPPGLDAIVARAMAKDPADRYPRAGALFDDVQDAFAAAGAIAVADAGTAVTGEVSSVSIAAPVLLPEAGPPTFSTDAGSAGAAGAPAAAASPVDDPARAPTVVAERARRRGWWIAAAALAVVLVAASTAAALSRRGTVIDEQLADSRSATSTTVARADGGTGGPAPGQGGTTVVDPTATSIVETIDPVTGAPVTSVVGAGNSGGGSNAVTPNVPTTPRSNTPTNGNQITPTTAAGQPGGGGITAAPGAVASATVGNPRPDTNTLNPDCGGEPNTVTVDVSWAPPASTGGGVERYVITPNVYNGAGGLVRSGQAVTVGGSSTSTSITVPRSDTPDAAYGYEVVAANAKGSSPAVRATVTVPSVLDVCSWTSWQLLRGVGLRPSETSTQPDPRGAADNRIFWQSLGAGTKAPAGTLVSLQSYYKP